MTAEEKMSALEALYAEWHACQKCPLATPAGRVRKNVVFGSGNADARLVIVGEMPDLEGEAHGVPFWPKSVSGDLLDRFLQSFGVSRDDVFLVDVVGCRATEAENPTKNRAPTKDEVAACAPRVHQILEIIDPYVILLLGEVAMKALTMEKGKVTALARDSDIPVVTAYTQGRCLRVERQAIVTFHPAMLARAGIDMAVGSDTHVAYKAFEKAIDLVRTYNQVYFNIPRGDTP